MSKIIGKYKGLTYCCDKYEPKLGKRKEEYCRCITCRHVYVDWENIYCTIQNVCDGEENIYVGDGTQGSVYKCSGCSACVR